MLTECAPRRVFDIRQDVFVIDPCDDLSKRDARREAEEFPTREHLPRELIEECKPLPIRSGFAEAGDGMPHEGGFDDSANDGDEDLQARNAL